MATLEIYLIRHGIAANRGEDYPDDSKRPLTSAGISRLRKEARALAAIQVDFDLIISSPLTRAKQTAEVFSQVMPSRPSITLSDSLAPAGTPSSVFQELGKHMRKSRIALVGHEPNMGELAARLMGARSPVEFKKGAICRIDFEVFPPKGAGQLRWFVTPKILRKLG